MTSGLKTSNPSKEFICQYCNTAFHKIIYPSTKIYPLFCSPSCRNKARQLQKIPCPICGKLFKPNIIDTNHQRKQNCSQKCAIKASVGRPSSRRTSKIIEDKVRSRYPFEGGNLLAEELGLTKTQIRTIAYKMGVKLNISMYRKIVHEAAREYMITNNPIKGKFAENHPSYKGGRKACDRGPNWKTQRNKAIKRDKHKCQNCGKCEKQMDVHHITHYDEFNGNWQKANALNNLITLCRRCHVNIEKGNIKLINSSEMVLE